MTSSIISYQIAPFDGIAKQRYFGYIASYYGLGILLIAEILPMPLCYCTKCIGTKNYTARTLRGHILADQQRLVQLQTGSRTSFRNFEEHLQSCIMETRRSLQSDLPRQENELYTHNHQVDEIFVDVGTIRKEDDLDSVNNDHQDTGSSRSDSESSDADRIDPNESDDPEIHTFIEADNNNSDTGSIPGAKTPEIDANHELPIASGEQETLKCTNRLTKISEVRESIAKLRMLLRSTYSPSPPTPPNSFQKRELDISEIASLQHYLAWIRSNGTVVGYAEHANVLEHQTHTEILSLHCVRKLAAELTNLQVQSIDMCPKSCVAYTGARAHLDRCNYISGNNKIECGAPRYRISKGKRISCARFTVLPVMATIRGMFANMDTSELLRHRDRCLQRVLGLYHNASKHRVEADRQAEIDTRRTYSDFGDGMVHLHHFSNMGLFQEKRDVAFAISTDGAQLTMKKQSNTWLLILIILNLPPEVRYKSNNIIINFATPGPNAPGDIESFLFPLFQEMVQASEGIWTWDAIDSSYFMNRAHIVMALSDMLGSAKINGMSGHSALYGDRFTTVQGARSSLKKGAKSQYYPLAPPNNDLYNPDRPSPLYENHSLPYRREEDISRATGVSRTPLCAASDAFLHPSFFPIDSFHLPFENCAPWFWDMWTVDSDSTECIHMSSSLASALGERVSRAYKTLPPTFCGPIRDPHLKRQSQYKMFEWMALVFWYIVPIGLEIGMNRRVLENFSQFSEIIEFGMTIKGRSNKDLSSLYEKIYHFLMDFENLYIGTNPERIYRARLCIFQLIHIPIHIHWNGSMRMGSQATVERAIGEMGHKIRSKKSPFANLTKIIVEREIARILGLLYPDLVVTQIKKHRDRLSVFTGRRKPCQDDLQESIERAAALSYLAKSQPDIRDVVKKLTRYGKLRLENNRTLQSRVIEADCTTNSATRYYRWFEVSFLRPY
jgi:hypothetical protein